MITRKEIKLGGKWRRRGRWKMDHSWGKIYVKSSVADPDPDVLGLPDPDPLVRGTDPATNPSTIKQKWSLVRYGSKWLFHIRITVSITFKMSSSSSDQIRILNTAPKQDRLASNLPGPQVRIWCKALYHGPIFIKIGDCLLLPVLRFRIRICTDPHSFWSAGSGSAFRIGNTDPDPDPGEPKWPTKLKKIQVLKC